MEMGAEKEGVERERDGGRKREGNGPRYEALEEWASSLPESFPEGGTRICLSTRPQSALPPCCPTEQQIGAHAHSQLCYCTVSQSGFPLASPVPPCPSLSMLETDAILN